MRVAEAFVDNVVRSERKLIVTITSGMGSIADNTSGGAFAYRSSKAAVNMVMRSLAIDLASRGITCVVINPGWVQTDMGGPRHFNSGGERDEAKTPDGDAGTSAIRQVLQLRRARIRLVGFSSDCSSQGISNANSSWMLRHERDLAPGSPFCCYISGTLPSLPRAR
jgi:NAD(P)-dependent dehydrogenase (short-subunit alcohol dehydrogenase family)